MKITIELPDWVKGQQLYILAGMELAAYKRPNERKWNIKTERCNQCGRCCMVHPKNGAYFPLKEDGSCSKLIEDGHKNVCTLGMEKPMACAIGEPTGKEYERFECSIQYRKG